MTRLLGLLALAVVCGAAFALTAHLLQQPTPVALAQETAVAPVVAAVPVVTTTEFEQDPFDKGLLRRNTITVREIALYHSDGQVTRVRP